MDELFSQPVEVEWGVTCCKSHYGVDFISTRWCVNYIISIRELENAGIRVRV